MDNVVELLDESIAFCNKAIELIGSGSPDDASSSNAYYAQYIKKIQLIKNKLNGNNVNVMVCGEVSTGKSSFINSLLGRKICATDVSACTNVISIIRYGEEPKAVVHFLPHNDGTVSPSREIALDEIQSFVSEQENHNNGEQVHLVEVSLPNDTLKAGLTFIDTPGLGAINKKHAIATYTASKAADVIFFLTSPLNQITASELTNLEKLVNYSSCSNIVCVSSKYDLAQDDNIFEKNKHDILSRIQQQIAFVKVSCSDYDEGKASNDESLVESSGMSVLQGVINDISLNKEKILGIHSLKSLLQVVTPLSQGFKLLKESAQSPTSAEKQKVAYTEVLNKIRSIKTNSSVWLSAMQNEFTNLRLDAEGKIVEKKTELINFATSKLDEKKYLSNPEELSSEIQEKLLSFTDELNEYLQEQVGNIAEHLMTESGLKDISKEIGHISGDGVPAISLPDMDGFKKSCYDIRSAMQSFFVVTATTAIGEAVGAGVGSLLAASAAGAAEGAAEGTVAGPWGAVVGFAVGLTIAVASYKYAQESAKKAAYLKEFTIHITDTMGLYLRELTKVIVNAQHAMNISFTDSLHSIEAECVHLKTETEKAVNCDEEKREKIFSLESEVSNLLSSIQSAVNGHE